MEARAPDTITMQPERLTVGSLFTGIGGFDLGLEWAGLSIQWMCERDRQRRTWLQQNWPHVEIATDVRGFEPPYADVICGGFPCQDISQANPNAEGLHGARSGLWFEMLRIIRRLRPRYAVVENVPALRFPGRGLGTLLGGLAEIGYDAEWESLQASQFGLPHKRERVFIVAYPHERRRVQSPVFGRAIPEALLEKQASRPRWRLRDFRAGRGRVFQAPEQAFVELPDGLSSGLAEIEAFGDALIPQIAEYIGTCLLHHAAQDARAS